MHHKIFPHIGAVISAVALSLASVCAFAAEWSAEPTVSLRQEYNDNINLTSLPHKAVWGTIFTPSITFSGKSEVLEVSGTAQLGFYRYSGAKGLDRDDRLFSLVSQYSAERDTWGLSIYNRRDSTRESELASTGAVLPRAQRTTQSIRPSWTHSLTERISLKLEYTLSDTKYENGVSVGLIDNKFDAASASVIYLLTDTDRLTISGARSNSEAVGSSDSTTDEVRLGLTHSFSETLQGDAQVGVRWTTSTYFDNVTSCDQPGQSFYSKGYCFDGASNSLVRAPILLSPSTVSNRGSVLNFGLSKKFGETAQFSARLSRDVSVGGRGVLFETDRFSLGYSKRYSDTLTGSINADLYRNRYPSSANQGSEYFTIAPNLNWRISEWWYLDAGVQYARQKYESAANSVSSNLVYGSIRYNWPKMAVSR